MNAQEKVESAITRSKALDEIVHISADSTEEQDAMRALLDDEASGFDVTPDEVDYWACDSDDDDSAMTWRVIIDRLEAQGDDDDDAIDEDD